MGFLGVYKAVYDYVPQSEGELAITEGDILYVLEKSVDDDWWKAKKKASADDDDEPVGLIPNNYIDEVRVAPFPESGPAKRTALANMITAWHRLQLSATRGPSTNTRAKPTRSFRSPKMPAYKYMTHRILTGSWWA